MKRIININLIRLVILASFVSGLISPLWGVRSIKSVDEFNKIIENSGNKLLVIDLYADWCSPCKTLSPMLEEIAKENAEKADFYKVNVDELRQLAAAFKVRGIPYVVFLKGNIVVHALTGLHPKTTYISAIDQLSQADKETSHTLIHLSPQETKQLMAKGEILLLDVRTRQEYNTERLLGAKLIPLDQLEKRLSEIQPFKGKTILVYCRSGNRSTYAGQLLLAKGFNDVYNLGGGILAWKKNSLPTVK